MALFYNTILRKNPSDPASPGKWYPILKSLGKSTEKEVAIKISDETTLNPKEAEMAIHQLLKVLKNELVNGKTVQLGDWGTFYLTINSEGVENESDVTAKQVKKIKLNFRPGRELNEAINKAELKPITSIVNKKAVE